MVRRSGPDVLDTMEALLAGGYGSSDEEELAKADDANGKASEEEPGDGRRRMQVQQETTHAEPKRVVKVGRPIVPPKESEVRVQTVRASATIRFPKDDSDHHADVGVRLQHSGPLFPAATEPKTGLDFLATLPPPKQTFHGSRSTLSQTPRTSNEAEHTERDEKEVDAPCTKSYHASSLYRVDADSPVEGPTVAPTQDTIDPEAGPRKSESEVLTSLITAEHRKMNRKRKGTFVQEAPNIVEIKQAELTSKPIIGHNPTESQAAAPGLSVMRGAPRPEQTTKRKHQITSLYYEAKQRELSIKENRAQGMKTRKETQAKYGW